MNKMEAFLNGTQNEKKDTPEIYKLIEKDFQDIFGEFLVEKKIDDFKHVPKLHKGKKTKNSGDMSTDICIYLSKSTKASPSELASDLVKNCNKIKEKYDQIIKIEETKFGHINIFLKEKKEVKEKIKVTKDLTFKFVKSEFIKEEYEIFRNYQEKIHLEDPEEIKESSYVSNFCNNAMSYQESPFEIDYGCYHLQYLLDDKIIAVSIVDILPYGMNCSYHFYDLDYSFLSIGVYSALKEIEIIQNFSHFDPRFKYYYLGSYVHTCPKVNYKAQYQKSELLCSDSNVWVDYKTCAKILDKNKIGPFVDYEIKDEEIKDSDMDLLFLYHKPHIKGFYGDKKIQELLQPKIHDDIKEFFKILGPHIARKFIFFIREEDVVGYKEKVDEKIEEKKDEKEETKEEKVEEKKEQNELD